MNPMTLGDYLAIATFLYLLGGFLFALHLDELQMRQSIPYPDVPSGFPLPYIRVVAVTMWTFFAVPLFLKLYVRYRRFGRKIKQDLEQALK